MMCGAGSVQRSSYVAVLLGTVAWLVTAAPLQAEVTVSAAAAHRGDFGLSVVLDSGPSYVTDGTVSGEARYSTRFYLNPDGVALSDGQGFDVLVVLSGDATEQIRLRLEGDTGGFVLATEARDGSAMVPVAAVTLAPGWQAVEVQWKAASAPGAADGALWIWHEGTEVAVLTDLENGAATIDECRLGAVASIDAGASGELQLDDFVSTRGAYISVAGDVNGDHAVDTLDLAALSSIVFAPVQFGPPSDVNGDASVDAADCAEQILVLSE